MELMPMIHCGYMVIATIYLGSLMLIDYIKERENV